MAYLLDAVIFLAAGGGTGSFTVSAAMPGYRTPVAAGAVDTRTYRYRAQSADLTQWECGSCVASSTGTVFARTLGFSSTGSLVNFTNPPIVSLTMLAADVLAFDDTMSLTAGQKTQGCTNLGAVRLTGDTMTGHLTLPTSPAAANAVRKDYVDAADALNVAKAGDTMTGPLVISSTAPIIQMAETDTGTNWYMVADASTLSFRYGSLGGTQVGTFSSGALTVTGSLSTTGNILANGGQLASNMPTGNLQFRLTETTGGWSKYMRTVNGGNLEWINNANSVVIMALTDTGALNTVSSITSNGGHVFSGNSGNGNHFYFGASGHGFFFDGSNIQCSAGGFYCPNATGYFAGNLYTGYANATAGVLYFGNNGTRYLQFDGTNYNFGGGGTVNCPADLFASGILGSGNKTQAGQGIQCRAGAPGGYGANIFNFYWNGVSSLIGYVDATGLGAVNFVSDYRLKKDVETLPSMWDTVKTLNPIKFTFQPYTPPSAAKRREETGEHMFKGSDEEQWGFLAHELQEALVPSAASGVKDDPDNVQAPNPFTIIAALTKGLQEAMARIEALEARP